MNNASIFGDWFSQMLCHLEELSIIVMDNPSRVEKYPKSNRKKQMLNRGYEKKI